VSAALAGYRQRVCWLAKNENPSQEAKVCANRLTWSTWLQQNARKLSPAATNRSGIEIRRWGIMKALLHVVASA
jgi:hypothetical protein